jgi:putative flavoprotein involved in K+ transport
MSMKTDTLVVGAGQAGLATSHYLSRAGRDHLVVDAGRVGETWRRARWDSFTLVTPNWSVALPGLREPLGPPDAFTPRDELVGMFERYARDIAAPVREEVAVHRLERDPADDDRYVARTSAGDIHARSVVIANGWFRKPRIPEFARHIAPSILQLDATAYRRPGDLPPGGVLVVGSGQSGVQIVEDLREAGREVWLSVGRAPRFPRRYRGRDIFEWVRDIGILDTSEDKMPDPRGRFAPNGHLTGARGGHTINLHRFARDGIRLIGRISGANGARLRIDPDLHERLAGVDRAAAELTGGIDKFVAGTAFDAPPADPTNSDDHDGREGLDVPLVEELDLEGRGISTIVWASGLTPDWSWVNLPVFDERQQPIHEGGVTRLPGIAFVGLRFQRWLKSDLLWGIGGEAENVVARLADRH